MLLKNCYGVDRQGDQLVAVLAQRQGGRVTCTAVQTERGATLSHSNSPVAAIAAIPTGRCLTRWIDTPFTSSAKARAVLPTLLDVQLPFPLESCHYVCVSLETGKTSSRALTAAVRQADLESELKALASSGVDPVLVDCEPLALWTQALHELPTPATNLTRAILYLGNDSIRMAVGHGNAYAGGHATRPDDTAQLVRFLKLYERPDTDPLEWWLCGPGAVDTKRVENIRSALAEAGPGRVDILQDPIRFLARAVATRALLTGPLRCNLRIGSATHPSLLKADSRQSMIQACLGLAAGILLIASNVGTSVYLNHKATQMDGEFRTLAESLAGAPLTGQKGEQAIQFVKNALQRKQGEMAPFLRRVGPSAADMLPSILAVARDHRIQIEHLIIEGNSVSIDGACASMSDCMALAEAVRKLGCAVSVRELTTLPGGLKGFSMTPEGPAI